MAFQVWTEEYKVTSFLVNLRGQAGLQSMLSFVQDVGWLHAINLKISLGKNKGWVFTRQKIQVDHWPKWNEVVTVKTWIRTPQSEKFLLRDYEFYLGPKRIGVATSTFSAFDLETRKISPEDWSKFSHIWKPDDHGHFVPQKIVLDQKTEELARFQVRNSDLDLNNHVNNTKYSQWVLDAIPLSVIKSETQLHTYEVNYLSEAKSGDVVIIKRGLEEKSDKQFVITQFQGVRETDGKLIFVSELKSLVS